MENKLSPEEKYQKIQKILDDYKELITSWEKFHNNDKSLRLYKKLKLKYKKDLEGAINENTKYFPGRTKLDDYMNRFNEIDNQKIRNYEITLEELKRELNLDESYIEDTFKRIASLEQNSNNNTIDIYEFIILMHYAQVKKISDDDASKYKKYLQSSIKKHEEAIKKITQIKIQIERGSAPVRPSSAKTPPRRPQPQASARTASQNKMPPPKKLQILPLNRVSQGNPPQAPLLTARTKKAKTKIDENMENTMINIINKKIVLVQKFNKNLEEFKKDYENIKELIQISTIDFGVSFTNNIFPKNITNKLNSIIKKDNNNCEKLIKETNINGFNDNDDLDESIKIFILLCYYINKLNCILNNFDNDLKDEHQSNKRFDNIKSINYLQETLSDIINQRNNINKNDENNKNINSKFIINEKEMSEVCKNINKILEKILNIFIGIHNDLNIKLIQEIIPFSEFNRILRNTKATTIEGTNQNAYDKLKKTTEYNYLVEKIPNDMNINTMINDLNADAEDYSKSDYTKLNNYIKFYILLKEQKFETSSTPRTGRNDPPTSRGIKTEQKDKSKQKILRSIRNLIAINYDEIKYPNYEFLNADKIYENKLN